MLWRNCYSMTTDAVYESMYFNGCSMARPFLSLRRVWLVRLTKEGSFVPMHLTCASQREMVWWTKSNFSGLLPKSGLRTNEIVRSYVHTSLTTVKFVHLNSSILVASEIKVLCSLSFNSVLRSADVNDLKTFSWKKVLSEAKNCAPTLLQLLESCTRPRIGRSPNPNRKAIIGLCICILCRYRCPSMSLFQKIISLILYAGHSAKQVGFLNSLECES